MRRPSMAGQFGVNEALLAPSGRSGSARNGARLAALFLLYGGESLRHYTGYVSTCHTFHWPVG
jgi:hypothetical protein